ncbi:discoidin domain-containing protein [Salinispora arenicola]|uniref:discoidin domain-containing protein n=1 Tax=Salinispora arenicola TaxID=168697 RepID=UPI0006ACF6C8|nr:discoidin domain-containing protein [Salinispora arenicola]
MVRPVTSGSSGALGPSALEWVSAGVAVVGGWVDEVVVALARSLPVAVGEVTVLGWVGGPAQWLLLAEELSAVVPSTGLVRLAVSGAGDEDDSGHVPAAVLAQRVGVEVVAPLGGVVVVPGGTLFAGAGWRRFGVGSTAVSDSGGLDAVTGRRFPVPGWQAGLDMVADEDGPPGWRKRRAPTSRQAGLDMVADEGPSAGLVRAVIPAGLWLYPDVPDQVVPVWDDLVFAVPVDVDRPMLLVGRPGVPAPDPEAVVAVADMLPRAVRGNLVIVPYGPGAAVCSQVSEQLSRRWARRVTMATGLPAATTSTRNRSWNLDHNTGAMGGPPPGQTNSLDETAHFPDHSIAPDRDRATSAELSIRSQSDQMSASSPPVSRGGRLLLGAALAAATVLASGGIVFALRADVDAGGDADWAAVSAPAVVASLEPVPTVASPTSIIGTPTAQGAPSQSVTPTASRDLSPTPATPTPLATNSPTAAPDITGRPNPTGRNLALSGTVTASSTEGASLTAQNTIDGDRTTRWSSDWGSDPQWIAVDLGSIWSLTEVRLVWEAAYATSYRVETSHDGTTWSSLRSITSGTGGTVRIDASSALARHVRVLGVQRATGWGYSLWEIEVR